MYEIPLKLQLIQDRAGNIKLMTYPVRKDIVSDIALNDDEKDRLRQGDTLRKEVKEDGVRRMQFIQMDYETKSLIKRNVSNLRLPEQIAQMEKVNDIQLGMNQKEAIKEGKPVELEVGHERFLLALISKSHKASKSSKATWPNGTANRRSNTIEPTRALWAMYSPIKTVGSTNR